MMEQKKAEQNKIDGLLDVMARLRDPNICVAKNY